MKMAFGKIIIDLPQQKKQYDFSNHAGLRAVLAWDKVIHGRRLPSKRSQYCLAAALAIVNETPMPPVPFEGNTNKPWRSAPARVETIKRILAQHEVQS
jgi:hypothetical protein